MKLKTGDLMTRQKTPHTQTQQNTNPEQTDLEPGQTESFDEAATDDAYTNMDGAESGGPRTPVKTPTRSRRRKTEPATSAQEGSLSTRSPKGSQQGITSHSSNEESARQEKVVKDRPDAQAGVNRSKKDAA
jgi:hypothetical protein